MKIRVRITLPLLLLAASLPAQRAPTSHPAAPQAVPGAENPAYTLQVNTQLIIEDITVTDRQGRPVYGLPRSAFHILDDKTPQTLVDFREQTAAAPRELAASAEAKPPTGVYSNASMLQNQGNLVAILIDPVTMQLEDQMYLRLQALKFIHTAPDGTAIALFRVNNQGVPVLLQPFTTDRALLATALSTAVPVLTRSTLNAFHNAVAELQNISDYLRAVPGHKAVLWMSGYFPLYIPPDVALWGGRKPDPDFLDQLAQTKEAYRALAAARIAVYPIDVRGVQMGGLSSTPVLDRSPNAGGVPGALGATPLSASERIGGQYDEMDRLADATGGKAFYSNNDVAGLMRTALQLSTSGYSLSYRPSRYALDGKWHTVSITVDGPYTVHFRTGYYTASQPDTAPTANDRYLLTAQNTPGSQPQPSPLPALPPQDAQQPVASLPPAAVGPPQPQDEQPALADAGTRSPTPLSAADAPAFPSLVAHRPSSALSTTPIVFRAHVLAQGRHRKYTALKVRYTIPPNQLLFTSGKGDGNARFRLAALAYNADGDVLSHGMEIVETHYTPDQIKLAARIGTPADQTLEVAHGARYLLLAVEDLRTERVGTIQLPLATIPSAPSHLAATQPDGASAPTP